MFNKALEETLVKDFHFNDSYTENGARGYRTTGSALVDINFAISSMRKWDEIKIEQAFREAWYENPLMAVKWLFYVRDVRKGIGERRLFRICYKTLFELDKNTAIYLLKFIPDYGRWDDLIEICEGDRGIYALEIIKKQLEHDIYNSERGYPISLLAKWLPSINTSSKDSRNKAKYIARKLNWSDAKYRKTLSKLRKYLGVIERLMANNEWDKIRYESVPSNANLKYSDAFLKHDRERREEYLDSLRKGDVKINAGTLFPYQIVAKYRNYYCWGKIKYNETLEQLWASLPNAISNNQSAIVVADGSGSMFSHIDNTAFAIDVAQSLAIYLAEKMEGEFKNKYISFSSHPELVDLSECKDLRSKILKALKYDDYTSTDIEKVFRLILVTAVSHNLKQSEIPDNIIVVSDMEFNDALYGSSNIKPLFEEMAKLYEDNGYKLPKLIFWNVGSRTNTIPMIKNDLGVVLVSGFSPLVANMIFNNKIDPYEVLIEQLNSKRYEKIIIV